MPYDRNEEPPKYKMNVTMSWNMDCPMIIFHMFTVIRGADLGSGFRSKIAGVGGSVAKARAAKVSMMRLTQRSWTAFRTDSSLSLDTADTNVSTTAVMLTVTWN